MMLHRIGWLAIGLIIASNITWAATGSETARTVSGWAWAVVTVIGLVFIRERLELRDRERPIGLAKGTFVVPKDFDEPETCRDERSSEMTVIRANRISANVVEVETHSEKYGTVVQKVWVPKEGES